MRFNDESTLNLSALIHTSAAYVKVASTKRSATRNDVFFSHLVGQVPEPVLPIVLKVHAQRSLHHTWRADPICRWLAKNGIGLSDLAVDDSEGQTGFDITEIRVVEEVVGLPAELKIHLLTQAKVLE